MELDLEIVANRIRQEIEVRSLQGYAVDSLLEQWERARDSREALMALHDRMKLLPLRHDWPYHEPSDLIGIQKARPILSHCPTVIWQKRKSRTRFMVHGWVGSPAASWANP